MSAPEPSQTLPPSPTFSHHGASVYAEPVRQASELIHSLVNHSSLRSNLDENEFRSRNESCGLEYISSPPATAPTPLLTSAPHARFSVPTKGTSLSSGFPFHPRLYDLQITHDEWHLFSNDIVDAGKLSLGDDYLAWMTGIATAALSTPLILVLGPVVGYYSGKSVHKKMVVKAVGDRLLQEGNLRSVLRRWNEETFIQKGFQVWLELPRNTGELDNGYLDDERLEGKELKKQRKVAKKTAERFRIVVIPHDRTGAFSRSVYLSGSAPSSQTAQDGDIAELHELCSELPELPAYTGIIDDNLDTPSPVSPASPSTYSERTVLDSETALSGQYLRPATRTNTLK